MTVAEKQEQVLSELDLFQDWTERYEYVIGLGRQLAPMPEAEKTAGNLIQGCQSRVWLTASLDEGKIRFHADSDSLITKGMIALFIRVLDGESPDAVLSSDTEFINRTGLREHLAPTRANALGLMAARMKQLALQLSPP